MTSVQSAPTVFCLGESMADGSMVGARYEAVWKRKGMETKKTIYKDTRREKESSAAWLISIPCVKGPGRSVFIFSKGDVPSDLIFFLPDLLKVLYSQNCHSGYPTSSPWILAVTHAKRTQTLVPGQRRAPLKSASIVPIVWIYSSPRRLNRDQVFYFYIYFSPSHIIMTRS